ncbi:YdcF family protein [Streptomyces sp. NPDC086783]|uniref:YdcF family protein n=1 Tax=Streptomyces sp. NPDC086783 TaxID=3365758 RepID=UPI00380F33F9
MGAGLDGGRPGPLLTRRLERALAIDATRAPDTPRRVFVVSGGQGDDEVRSEADAMADHLRGRGVPARDKKRSCRVSMPFSETSASDHPPPPVPDHPACLGECRPGPEKALSLRKRTVRRGVGLRLRGRQA